MPDHARHPLRGPETSLERIARWCSRVAPLFVLGVLQFWNPVFGAFYLFGLLIVVPIAVDLYTDDVDPTGWIRTATADRYRDRILSALVAVHPTVVLQTGLHWAGVVAYRGRDMDPDLSEYEGETELRLPFDGEWAVLAGSTDREYAHSTVPPQHRYAYDFVMVDESGATYDGGQGPESHHCYGAPILAPADGTVVRAVDAHRDYPRSIGSADPRQTDVYGNHVIIDHGGEYSLLAHLQNGSVAVAEGETVERGDRIGRCGHSGNSDEPQLHFQLLDRRNPHVGVGLPVTVDGRVEYWEDADPTTERSEYLHCGQLVSPHE